MQTPDFCVDGIDVYVQGQGPQTVVMVHGWPDSHRLWDATVEGLQDSLRCVRFTLPGFDLSKPARAESLASITATIARVVNAVSPNAPVTLLLHDWGCTFGYEFAGRHPDKVARIVAVDIGDHNAPAYLRSLSSADKWGILVYQFWLACAWYMGQRVSAVLGNAMTRWMARRIGCPAPAADMHWQRNYPYAMLWMNLRGGLRGCVRVNPACPVLFVFGERKPFMFHSTQWLEHLAAKPGSRVQAFACGHWIMLDQPVEFVACVKAWLMAP